MITTSKKSGSSELAWWTALVIAVVSIFFLLFLYPGGEDGNIYRNIFKSIVDGRSGSDRQVMDLAIITSILVVLCSVALSFVIGVFIGGIQLMPHPLPRFVGALFVETIRGIPIYVMLLFVYFGVKGVMNNSESEMIISLGKQLTPFRSAVIALGVCYGAYMAEVVRAGLLSIPVEEIEAASLEARGGQVFIYIILPQALRTILPAIANECIALLKDSAIVGVVTLVDITRSAQMYGGSTFNYFEAFTALALIYLVLSLVLSRLQRTLEFHFGDAKAHRAGV